MLDAATAPQSSLDEKALYAAIGQCWVYSEQARWTLLNNYLVASSIVLLAWATVFAGQKQAANGPVLVVLCIAGMAMSAIWGLLLYRATKFVTNYAALAMEIEDLGNPQAPKPFQSARRLRESASFLTRRISSHAVLVMVPTLLFGLFAVLTFTSLTVR